MLLSSFAQSGLRVVLNYYYCIYLPTSDHGKNYCNSSRFGMKCGRVVKSHTNAMSSLSSRAVITASNALVMSVVPGHRGLDNWQHSNTVLAAATTAASAIDADDDDRLMVIIVNVLQARFINVSHETASYNTCEILYPALLY